MKYTNVKVNITDDQKEKLKNATGPVSIRFNHSDLTGNNIIALTKSQVQRLAKAYENGRGITIKLSKAQLVHNVEGGFLGALAGIATRALPIIAKTVLPALGVGALSGLASSGVQKAIGNGLYLKKGGCVCQVETNGEGLYLSPANDEFKGDGLYLKQGGKLYDGNGILGDLLKQVPIIGTLI